MLSTVASYKSKQMERLQTCPICLDKFRLPKVLPCLHTFCLAPCLSNLVEPRARSLRCPECHREHRIPPGGIQAFPDNAPIVASFELQPARTTMTTIDLPDRCFICKQQKRTLIECQDCSQYLCTDCREPHLREAFYSIRSSVGQLRRSLPRLNERMASYDQRVNYVRTNTDQIRREITSNVGALIDELKYRETTLLTEAEANMQSQLRAFYFQQQPVEAEITGVTNFCQSIEGLNPNAQLINDTDLANMRARCNQYSQQLNVLQTQIPIDTQQNFGRLLDPIQERQQPQFSSASPQTTARYRGTSQNSRNNSRQSRNDPYQYAENYSHFRGSSLPDLSSTLPARLNGSSISAPWASQTVRRASSNLQSSIFGANPFANSQAMTAEDERSSAPPQLSPRRQFVTSTNAARSLEGDDRPIFGGSGRGRGRLPSIASIPENQPLPNRFQRRGTFILDRPSLPNLPQSGAERPRDKVNVDDLYKVRRRKRARTPVAFTINLNESPPSRASEMIDGGTV